MARLRGLLVANEMNDDKVAHFSTTGNVYV
jgi:hypothetical protein